MKVEFQENLISERAIRAISLLKKKNFDGYLVGGAVRDILLGITPKDFDIATNAPFSEIKRIFPEAVLIGKRFKLAQIVYKNEKIEISTYRRDPGEPPENLSPTEKIRWKNKFFGNIEEDARRRDFTINSLYLDPFEKEILDFTGGLKDLENKMVRIVGDPYDRFMEDPVRMIRCCALSMRLGFKIEEGADKNIDVLKNELCMVPKARISEEILRILKSGSSLKIFELLEKKGILKIIMPFPYNFSSNFKEALKVLDSYNHNFTDEEFFIFLFFSLNFKELKIKEFSNFIEKESFLHRRGFIETLKIYFEITQKIFFSKKKNFKFFKNKYFLRILKFSTKLSIIYPEFKKNVKEWKTFYYKFRKNFEEVK